MKRLMNVLRYLLLLALDIYVMAVFHSYVSFLFFLGMLLFPVYSIAGARHIAKSLKPEVVPPAESMYRGESAVLHFGLNNPTLFVSVNALLQIELSNTFYGENSRFTLNLPVRAKGVSRMDWELDLQCCGHVTAKITSVIITDLLGVYTKKTDTDICADFLILPCGEAPESEAGRIYLQGMTETEESKGKGYDFSDVSGIRTYIPGDKLQNIHWKLSAKQRELMVKERVGLSSVQLNVLLDLEDDGSRRLEAVLELAEGVTRDFIRQNLPYAVFYYSVNTGELRSFFVGSEKERVQWMEQLMYDHCCDSGIDVEELFRRDHPEEAYLYIGTKRKPEDAYRMNGRQQAVAVLRG